MHSFVHTQANISILFQSHINYPDVAPEFKNYTYITRMTEKMNSLEQNRFKTISEFKECLHYHGEVEFEWKGIQYSITHPSVPMRPSINIAEAFKDETEMFADTADEILEYMVAGDRLCDVITQVKVWFRSIRLYWASIQSSPAKMKKQDLCLFFCFLTGWI